MKNTIKKTLAGLVLAAASILPAQADNLRLRTELTQNDTNRVTQETVGVGNNKGEYFRAYNFGGTDNNPEFSAAAVSQSFGNSTTTVFGSTGDKQGEGLETSYDFGDLTLRANLEKSEANQFSQDATRIGGGAEYTLTDKLRIGAGFDRIHDAKGESNAGLVNVIYDPTNTDQLLGAFRTCQTDTRVDNSVIGAWTHYGKDESWGTRTWGKYDWNNQNEDTSFSWDSIWAQNPTFLKDISTVFLVRNERGGMYNAPVVTDALETERTPLGNRSKGGIVADFSGKVNDTSVGTTGNARVDLGYKFPKFALGSASFQPTLTGFYNFDLSGNNADQKGASALVGINTPYLNFGVEATVTEPTMDKSNPTVYFSLTASKTF